MGQSVMIVAINRPIEQVFAFVANAETAPEWQSEIVDVHCTSTGSVGVGTTYRALRAQLREQIVSTLEITEYELNAKISFERVWGELTFRDTYTFRAIGDCTRITYAFDIASGTRATRHAFNKEAADLSNLKNVLEARNRGPRPTGRAPQSASIAASSVRSPHAAVRPVVGSRPTRGVGDAP